MILEISRSEVPRARRDRINRSSETDGSPASILAMRDWLDLSTFARSACESRFRCRRSRRPSASRILSSMYADSSLESRRNSLTLPIFQPLASNRLFFSSRIFILLKSSFARLNDGSRCLRGLFAEDFQDHDGIRLDSVHNAPRGVGVIDAQLVAPRPNGRHGPGVRHSKQLAPLQTSQQISRLHSGSLGERWGLDFSVQPNKRFVAWAH